LQQRKIVPETFYPKFTALENVDIFECVCSTRRKGWISLQRFRFRDNSTPCNGAVYSSHMAQANHRKLANLEVELAVNYLQQLGLNPPKVALIVCEREQRLGRPWNISTHDFGHHLCTPSGVHLWAIHLVHLSSCEAGDVTIGFEFKRTTVERAGRDGSGILRSVPMHPGPDNAVAQKRLKQFLTRASLVGEDLFAVPVASLAVVHVPASPFGK
jgi:hypothetical protein